MALFDEDWIKRILSGDFSAQQDLGKATGQVPVPGPRPQTPIERLTLGADAAAPVTAEAPAYEATGLLGMLPKQMQPESEASQQALARALLLGGASAMANPGQNWMSSIGTIIGNGTQAYDGSLASQLKTQEEQKKQQLAAEQQQMRDTMAAQIASDDGSLGFSMNKLRQLYAYYTKMGDDTSARQVQAQMQEVSKQAASKGMIYDESAGKFVPAPGYEDGVNQMTESEAAAKERGTQSEKVSPEQLRYNEYVASMEKQGKTPLPMTEWIAWETGQKESQSTTDQKDYKFYVAQEQAAGRTPLGFDDWVKSNKSGFQVKTNADGTVEVTQGPKGTGDKLTEGQSKDIGFYSRGRGANDVLNPNEKELTNFWDDKQKQVPWIGNYLLGDKYKSAQQSGKEFLMAILRKDTGAAITPSEEDYYGEIYLPQPGDSEAQIKQKRAARERALEGLKAGMSIDQIERVSRVTGLEDEADAPADKPEDKPADKPADEAEKTEAGSDRSNPIVIESAADANKHRGKWISLNGRVGFVK